MTEYKIGDRVLWDAKIGSIATNGKIWLTSMADESRGICSIDPEELRPYTPRQEFEYGEEVEVKTELDSHWLKAKFIGKSHHRESFYAVNTCDNYNTIYPLQIYQYCRKPQPRDTITIGNTTYDKLEFENAVKDLKPVEGK